MASSMTMTASFFGGAVAAKPAAATTRRSQLAVRASMDLEKAVEKNSNTRRGLMLAAAGAAAVSSVAKVAMAADDKIQMLGGWTEVKDPSAPEYLILATFAVSEYNKQNNKALTLNSVIKAETQVVAGVNYRLRISARDEIRPNGTFQAVVYSQAAPTSLHLTDFVGISR
ncbi:hypothetical protein SASPL_139183 [Salvia splendens]|uniref:Cystatin domain-containing protein n=1 Tax=Salvia splendens TaxID=180675 RepID=A0A8X8WXU4_SALSN|nr:cysteine proteinase inhibitor 1-like [Salvia splendens]KAG6402305.1 hypothetical protein SASPL_139183 [Salvia splendens]